MNQPPASQNSGLEELRREVAYLRRRIERLAANLVQADTHSAAMRHELEQKRRGFTLMGELAVTLGQDTDYENAFTSISSRINGALNMQRTVVLTPNDDGSFSASVLQGYAPEARATVSARRITLPAAFRDPLRPVLVTAADPDDAYADLRQALVLNYLISTPVVLHGDIVAVLVTGRLREQRPFLPRLGHSDVETVQAVGAYLAAVLAGQRMRHAESLANFDPLTELPNLRMATEHLHRTLALARRDGFRCAVMFIDLDGFKVINDTLTHAGGDAALRRVAERLRDCVREADIVGRIGGDEFVLVLSHVDREDDVAAVAGKVLATLADPIDVSGTACRIGASIGIALYPQHGDEATALLRAADEAMYAVKNTGKNGFRFAG